MTKKISVKVLADGSVQADFVGFAGDNCLDEADRLAENLARFGLAVDPAAVRKKSQAEIDRELGEDVSKRGRVPTPSE